MKSRMEISIWESVLVSSMTPLTVSTYCGVTEMTWNLSMIPLWSVRHVSLIRHVNSTESVYGISPKDSPQKDRRTHGKQGNSRGTLLVRLTSGDTDAGGVQPTPWITQSQTTGGE